MTYDNKDVASRLRGLREVLELTPAEIAVRTSISEAEYIALEEGTRDFSLSFLYKCAQVMGVDLIELLTGEVPRLHTYTLVRAGEGLPIERRVGFAYRHLAYLFRGKKLEPLVVKAPYSETEQQKPIPLSSHAGQEFDFVLQGSLRVVIDGHEELLGPGDAVLYDSGRPHGMIAANGQDCEFLAILTGR